MQRRFFITRVWSSVASCIGILCLLFAFMPTTSRAESSYADLEKIEGGVVLSFFEADRVGSLSIEISWDSSLLSGEPSLVVIQDPDNDEVLATIDVHDDRVVLGDVSEDSFYLIVYIQDYSEPVLIKIDPLLNEKNIISDANPGKITDEFGVINLETVSPGIQPVAAAPAVEQGQNTPVAGGVASALPQQVANTQDDPEVEETTTVLGATDTNKVAPTASATAAITASGFNFLSWLNLMWLLIALAVCGAIYAAILMERSNSDESS